MKSPSLETVSRSYSLDKPVSTEPGFFDVGLFNAGFFVPGFDSKKPGKNVAMSHISIDKQYKPISHTNLEIEYFKSGDWVVGNCVKFPEIHSQGKTLAELEANIIDALAEMYASYRNE